MTNNQKRTRPTTLEEYNSRFDGLVTEHGRNIGLNFQPDPTDIIITPYAKSGTTWLQQIVHGLRTRG
ncbi:MAG: sulfotransferase domain-containing protein, partial [Chloroflexota bacterium]